MASTVDKQKRVAAYALARDVVLVKLMFLTMKEVKTLDLHEAVRVNEIIHDVHKRAARMRGLNAYSYRSIPDTGHPCLQGERNVEFHSALEQVLANGLHYAGGHWYRDERHQGQPVVVLQFQRDGEPTETPTVVRELLTRVGKKLHVWANLAYQTDETGEFLPDAPQRRLDTWNVGGLRPAGVTPEDTRSLQLFGSKGHTYRVG
ncbi:hypothetical protein KJ903_04545 [Patescibacteria group bacterium]|nr:hypothetical protein [Patescibacteria group bacterium]